MALSPLSKGRGAETSDLGQRRSPICTSQKWCGVIDRDVEYAGDSYLTMPHIPSAAVCCEKCQADLKCAAWVWERLQSAAGAESGPCHLHVPQPDRSPPFRLRRRGFVSGLPVREHARGTLYCIALMQPSGYEPALLRMQHRERVSIFLCDESAAFSSSEVEIALGVKAVAIESDLRCRIGGDAGTALNTGIFIALWKRVISLGRFQFHDWTVKVDPDSVFFPDRLRSRLAGRAEGVNGTYLNNCKYGLHGPIEVLSRRALENYGRNYLRCEQKFWFAYTHWGEDMYMDQCLKDVLGVRREDDWSLICEDHCDCPEYLECKTGAITFHPFKTISAYRQCMLDAGSAPTG